MPSRFYSLWERNGSGNAPAKFIRRYPAEALPPVSAAAEREEELRQLISMKPFQVKARTALMNRLRGPGGTGEKVPFNGKLAGWEPLRRRRVRSAPPFFPGGGQLHPLPRHC